MTKPLVLAAAVWVVGSAFAFLVLDPVLAAFVVILGAVVAAMAPMVATWDEAPTFEEREMVRARKRAARRERTKDARAADRARYEAGKARRSRS